MVVLLGLACATTASAPSWRTLQQQRGEPGAKPVNLALTSDVVDRDLAVVLHALERGYGGRAFVPPAAWDAMRAGLEAARRQARTVGALCDALADAFWLLPDAHLSARRQDTSGYNVRCGTRATAGGRRPGVGVNRHNGPPGIPWSAQTFEQAGTRLLRVSIQAFPPEKAPVWDGFTQALEARASVDAVVVDLRGNGGGDDSRGYELASALLDGPVEGNVVRTHYRQTPETLTLLLNTIDRTARQPDGQLAPYRTEMYRRIETWRNDAIQANGNNWPEYKVEVHPPYTPTPGPRSFTGRIAVLVDAGCASSCESTLEVLRRHPNTRVYGERTGGYIHFGDVGSLTLANTGIRLGIPTKYQEYPGGVLYDKVGFEPDVTVSPGDDAWDAALAWLTQPG